MLNENLRILRKNKGLSQEELAIKLNVVRQTVSKWEKGLSVPDSDMLIQIANALDTTVNALLGETLPESEQETLQSIASKLEVLNEQFAKEKERSRKIQRAVYIVLGIVSVICLIIGIVIMISYWQMEIEIDGTVGIIGGADGPTAIFVAKSGPSGFGLIIALVTAIVSAVGIYKTKK